MLSQRIFEINKTIEQISFSIPHLYKHQIVFLKNTTKHRKLT